MMLWAIFLITPCFTYNIYDYWIANDLLAFSIALLTAAWIHKQYPVAQHPVSWMLLCLFLIPVYAHLIMQDTPNPWGLVKGSMYITATFLIFRMCQGASQVFTQQTSWIALLAITGNIFVWISMLQVFHLFQEDQHSLFAMFSYSTEFIGPLLQRNLTTLFLLIVVASLWIQSIRTSFDKRWLLASILPCTVILISNSRSALLLLIGLSLCLFILHQKKKDYLYHIIPTLFFSLLIALEWHLTLQTLHHNLEPMGSRLGEAGISARLNLWYSSALMFFDHPWFGVGSGNLASYFADYQAQTLHQHPQWTAMDSINPWSHNIILQQFAEGGIFSGIFILLLFGIVGKRIYRIFKSTSPINHPSFPAAIIIILLLSHGLVSISLLQGFFLSLFGLYLAALFPSEQSQTQPQHNTNMSFVMHLIPAMYMAFTAYQYIHTQVAIRAVFDDPPGSPRFIEKVGTAIDNPWLTRVGLDYLFVNMGLTHAPARQWINLYPYLYESWLLGQDPQALKRLILQAHLTDNTLSEKYLANLYIRDFPKNSWDKELRYHIEKGHQAHEPLDIQ